MAMVAYFRVVETIGGSAALSEWARTAAPVGDARGNGVAVLQPNSDGPCSATAWPIPSGGGGGRGKG
eukprot:364189-Chlamydomonas_euryale.AAC.9